MTTIGEKEIKKDWPVEEGIDDFETQSQIGRVANLVPSESLVPNRLKVGL